MVNKKERGEILEALDIKYIYGMMKNMERMGLDEHVASLREWNRNVYVDILHSADWKQLNASNLSDEEYDSQRRQIMKKYVCKHLDDKYKQATHHPEIPGFENMLDDFATDQEEDDRMSLEPPTKEQMRELVERNPAVGTIIDKLGLIADDDEEEAPF